MLFWVGWYWLLVNLVKSAILNLCLAFPTAFAKCSARYLERSFHSLLALHPHFTSSWHTFDASLKVVHRGFHASVSDFIHPHSQGEGSSRLETRYCPQQCPAFCQVASGRKWGLCRNCQSPKCSFCLDSLLLGQEQPLHPTQLLVFLTSHFSLCKFAVWECSHCFHQPLPRLWFQIWKVCLQQTVET